MASIVLPILFKANPYVGAALGILGAVIDNAIISALSPGQTVESGKLTDIDYQTATLGAGIKKGYGTCKVTGNIIWGTKFTEHVTEETQGGGKGGGGTKVTTKTYTYSSSFAVMISEGPITSLKTVYADGNEFDLTSVDYRLYSGTETQEPDDFMESIEGVGTIPAYRGLAYIVFRNMQLEDYGNRVPSFSFVVEYPKNDLKDIVEDIATEAGLILSQDFEAGGLSGIVIPGYTRDGTQTFKEQINQLRMCNIFDGVERNGVVSFGKRDFSKVIPVTQNDYGAYEIEPDDNPLSITTQHDLSLPKQLKVTYVSSDNAYQSGVATGYRQLSGATGDSSVTTNMVMTDSHAKEIAEMRLYEAWMARTSYEFKLGNALGWVLPGDILELTLHNGNKQLILVQSTNYGRPGINVVKGCNVNSAVYNVVTRAVDTTPEPIVTVPSEVIYAILDIPKLPLDTSSGDDYVYIVSGGSSYFGANVFRSYDNGVNYSLVASNSYLGIVGQAATKLGTALPYSWDNANTVDVQLDYGSLESRTREDLLNYYNTALIGQEIIQFRYAELLDGGLYRLSGLLRGRCGTEQNVDSHVAGEQFVLLEKSSINTVAIASDSWYKAIPFRIGPKGKSVLDDDYKDDSFTPQGNTYRPWAGCHCKVIQKGNSYYVTWIRRTRKDGAWKDYSDVPLSENSEVYSVDVIGTDGSVLRTFSAEDTSFSYAAATDISGFDIYQISESRGRGWPLKWRKN